MKYYALYNLDDGDLKAVVSASALGNMIANKLLSSKGLWFVESTREEFDAFKCIEKLRRRINAELEELTTEDE